MLITEYCEKNRHDRAVRNNSFCIYYSRFLSAKLEFENNCGREPSEDEIKVIRQSLLTDESISGYVDTADIILRETNEKLMKQYKNNISEFRTFFISTSASTLGGFVYSLLLIAIFYVAKDQIKNWLLTLMK
jgi:hypothetical protein